MRQARQFKPALWAWRAAGIMLVLLMASCAGRARPDPAAAAKEFFERHFDFYTLEDLPAVEKAVTPEFYALLNRIVAEGYPMGYYVSACAWTDSQDGWFKGDPVFTVDQSDGRRAVVRMDYAFEMGSEVEIMCTKLTLEWDDAVRRWRVADLEGPDQYPFVQNHLDWFEQIAEKGWFERVVPGAATNGNGPAEPQE